MFFTRSYGYLVSLFSFWKAQGSHYALNGTPHSSVPSVHLCVCVSLSVSHYPSVLLLALKSFCFIFQTKRKRVCVFCYIQLRYQFYYYFSVLCCIYFSPCWRTSTGIFSVKPGSSKLCLHISEFFNKLVGYRSQGGWPWIYLSIVFWYDLLHVRCLPSMTFVSPVFSLWWALL